MNLEFSKVALADLKFWKSANRKTAQRVSDMLIEICNNPYSGRGKPEQLSGNLSGYWSRRINSKDRIIYSVDEESKVIFVLSLRKHYE